MAVFQCFYTKCPKRAIDKRPVLQCPGCNVAVYCSRNCQRFHWSAHSVVCRHLRDATGILAINESISRQLELQTALWGDHANVVERITLREFKQDPEHSDSVLARRFADSISVFELIKFGLEQFLRSHDKGAIVLNIKYPYEDIPSNFRLHWLPRPSIENTGQVTLARQINNYDPANTIVVYFMKPSEDFLSVQCWCRQYRFVVQPPILSIVEKHKLGWKTFIQNEESRKLDSPGSDRGSGSGMSRDHSADGLGSNEAIEAIPGSYESSVESDDVPGNDDGPWTPDDELELDDRISSGSILEGVGAIQRRHCADTPVL